MDNKSVLLISMPFAAVEIPSIQLAILESYIKERGGVIQTRHLYLKAAETYGLSNYNYLIYPPNDSYNAQIVFSRYVFPDHWEKNLERFREFFNNRILDGNTSSYLSFEEYIEKTDIFYQWIFQSIKWDAYDIIGFTLNYGQLLPSLAVAKRIKERWPDKKIILGGSRTIGELGLGVMKAFPYIDFVVSGDGEEPLRLISCEQPDYSSIPGLIYRKGEEIIWNKGAAIANLDTLPVPLYDQFYRDLTEVNPYIGYYFRCLQGRLPVEISRGCWWNKCTFCNLNIQHQCYREKNTDKIVEEITTLSKKHRILRFQIIGNTLPREKHILLLDRIIETGKPFLFFAEARADQLTSEDYTHLKEAGFLEIQTGIEAFSRSYLKKMNKGTRVIDNIAALKFSRENNIQNKYNIIINYPNEEFNDFNESVKTINMIKAYLDPPQICNLHLFYGSPIYKKTEDYNIEKLEYIDIDKVMYPPDILEKKISFIYSYKKKIEMSANNWKDFVEEWKNEREKHITKAIKSHNPIDEYVFYFIDEGEYLEVYDNRHEDKLAYYLLEGFEREVLLACTDITTRQELKSKLIHIPDNELDRILGSLEEANIILHEDDSYLTLPLNYHKISNRYKKNTSIKEQTIICSNIH
ncbi:MAG: RiPP maturation radical SAM C-methyltransferase [Candidatus Thermoplasmatota archaeon]